MKKLLSAALCTLMLGIGLPAVAACTKIQSGLIFDTQGNVITVGYDKYGYNYQAHMFNGLYKNYSRPTVVVTEGSENLVMKWSDDWIANVDCNGDGKLDKGLTGTTTPPTGTSMGWVTNHFEGDYLGTDGDMHHYTYFAKIAYVGPAVVGVPDPYAARRIWGVYAIIEEIQSDHYGEYGGRLKFIDRLTGPGLGQY